MWFPLEHQDLRFVDRAPNKLEFTAVVPAPPARVFEILSTAERQREWFQDFVADRWTSPPPHGVGSTREIELKMLSVKERFLAWEEGKRLAFAVDAITIPLVKAMLEDMQLEPSGEGSTRLAWRVYYRPSLAMRLVHPVGRAIFGRMFKASVDGLARYAAVARSAPAI